MALKEVMYSLHAKIEWQVQTCGNILTSFLKEKYTLENGPGPSLKKVQSSSFWLATSNN